MGSLLCRRGGRAGDVGCYCCFYNPNSTCDELDFDALLASSARVLFASLEASAVFGHSTNKSHPDFRSGHRHTLATLEHVACLVNHQVSTWSWEA